MPALAVACRNLVKRFGSGANEVYALRGATLEIPYGELSLLVGPSGCGKTTLISIVAGILSFDEGQCIVLGQNLGSMSEAQKIDFRRDLIGFVFQAYNLIPTLTCAENVAVPLIIKGVARKDALQRAHAMLERVKLVDKSNRSPRDLSGGQQQRVAIARALIHEPKVLVCDEPTSALDHETGNSVMQLIKEVAVASDRAVIVVTHDSRIFDFADRIDRMDDGTVI